MKMGYSTVENSHVQTVLFPLLDYCTDISVVNRAETLLEDGLRLWLVVLVSSRLATMGLNLTNVSPALVSRCLVKTIELIFAFICPLSRCFLVLRLSYGLDWNHT